MLTIKFIINVFGVVIEYNNNNNDEKFVIKFQRIIQRCSWHKHISDGVCEKFNFAVFVPDLIHEILDNEKKIDVKASVSSRNSSISLYRRWSLRRFVVVEKCKFYFANIGLRADFERFASCKFWRVAMNAFFNELQATVFACTFHFSQEVLNWVSSPPSCVSRLHGAFKEQKNSANLMSCEWKNSAKVGILALTPLLSLLPRLSNMKDELLYDLGFPLIITQKLGQI